MDTDFALDCLVASNDTDKQRLAQLLWGWSLCGQCTGKPSCSQRKCAWSRKKNLAAFWTLYERMTVAYIPGDPAGRKALKEHSDVLSAIQSIGQDRTASKKDLMRKIFESGGAQAGPPPKLPDQKRAFNISAGVLLLMDFGTLHDAANISKGSLPPVVWRDGVSLDSFVKEAFHYATPRADLSRLLVDIKAKKLVKNAKVHLESTNDIRRHLLLDHKERVVWIFHQCTTLRELLLSTESDPTNCILPRAMMLEVLETTRILFLRDSGSRKLLESFVSQHGWDEGLLSDLSTPYPDQSDGEITYAYFGDRLEELHKELQSPTPHGWFEKRLNRRSDMNMLKATVIGALIAVTLTLLTLVVALFQAWVAWQQWKHPVKEV
jgi:hypothetical protein